MGHQRPRRGARGARTKAGLLGIGSLGIMAIVMSVAALMAVFGYVRGFQYGVFSPSSSRKDMRGRRRGQAEDMSPLVESAPFGGLRAGQRAATEYSSSTNGRIGKSTYAVSTLPRRGDLTGPVEGDKTQRQKSTGQIMRPMPSERASVPPSPSCSTSSSPSATTTAAPSASASASPTSSPSLSPSSGVRDSAASASGSGFIWSTRGSGRAFALNASTLLRPPTVRLSKHACINEHWGVAQVDEWGSDPGTPQCIPGGDGRGARMVTKCATFGLQGGRRCFQDIEFTGHGGFAPAVRLKSRPGGKGWPSWLLQCDVAPGGRTTSSGDALSKVFEIKDAEGGEVDLLLQRGHATAPEASTPAPGKQVGASALLDRIERGPPPGGATPGGLGEVALVALLESKDSGIGEPEAAAAVELVAANRGAWSTGFVYYIVNRDCGPSAEKQTWNPFHCLADAFNAVQVMAALRLRPAEVVVLFSDSRAESPYEHIWRTLGGGGVYSASRMAAIPAEKRPPMKRAIIGPTSGASIMWQKNHDFVECRHASEGYAAVRRHFLQGLGLWPSESGAGTGQEAGGNIVLVSRQPKPGLRMDRLIANEEELLAAMRRGVQRASEVLPHVVPSSMEVRSVDYTGMQIREQLKVAVSARVIVGMHGAGMTWSMFQLSMPGSALIELHPWMAKSPNAMISKCFANQAVLSGLNYLKRHVKKEETDVKEGSSVIPPDVVQGLLEAALGADPTEDSPGAAGPGIIRITDTAEN